MSQTTSYASCDNYLKATSESEAKVIEVSEGSEATNVDITVSDPIDTHNVYGRVVDADTGQPVDGVKVVVDVVSGDGLHDGDRGMDELQSGPNGAFRFFGLAPGKYAIFNRSRFNNGFIGKPIIFDISAGDVNGVELKVRRSSGAISGVVVIEGTKESRQNKVANLYPFTGGRPGLPPLSPDIHGGEKYP